MVASVHKIVYGSQVQQSFSAPYDILSRQSLGILKAVYDIRAADPVTAVHAVRYNMTLQSVANIPIPFLEPVRSVIKAVYDLAQTVNAIVRAPAPINSFDAIRSVTRVVYPLVDAAVASYSGARTITVLGRVLDVLDIRLGREEDQTHWTVDIRLKNVIDYGLFSQDTPFTVNLYGESYSFIVDGKELRKSGPEDVAAIVNGVSPTKLFDEPRAPVYSVLHSADVGAKAAAEQALSFVVPGTTIDWQMVDWVIPAFRLAAESISPLEFVRKIVVSAGGVLESTKSGSFVARKAFPVAVDRFDSAIPDHEFRELQHIVRSSQQFVPSPLVNSIRIVDTQADRGDILEYTQDTADPFRGVLRAFPAPYRENISVLSTSPAASVQVSALHSGLPQTLLVQEEDSRGVLVEFVAGVGSVQYPIHSLVSVQWLSESLGGLSFEQSSTQLSVTGPGLLYGLARIRYNTKYFEYDVRSSISDSAQFLLEEV